MKTTAELRIRLITHNIRYATTSPFTGEKPWSDRRPLLHAQLRYHTLYNPESFICLQEVLHSQLVSILSDLNSTPTPTSNSPSHPEDEWAYIGVGRDDGKTAGEYSPIFYKPKVWKLESWKTVWLSETPNVPGTGWDAASVRIVTVGRWKHRKSGKRVLGLGTHFDDQGVVSRRESAKLVLKIVEQETLAEGNQTGLRVRERLPVFLAGDLNSEPDGEAYQILNGEESSLRDVQDLLQGGTRYGEQYTFTGFLDSERKTEIDHLFVGTRGSEDWEVRGFAVLANRFEDGVYVSDHRAVVADLGLRI